MTGIFADFVHISEQNCRFRAPTFCSLKEEGVITVGAGAKCSLRLIQWSGHLHFPNYDADVLERR